MSNFEKHDHANHQGHLNPWLLGGFGAVTALSLAPYLLPIIGIGEPFDPSSHGGTHMIMNLLGLPATEGALGSGLAGSVAGAISHIPIIGTALTSTSLVTIPGTGISIASGALMSVASAAVIGIGGMFVADWLEKREAQQGNTQSIRWSQIVRYGSLATSILISLPSLLTGISVGIAFIAAQIGVSAGWQAIGALRGSIGAVSMGEMGAASGIVALIPHLFSCGLASLPIIGSLFLGKKEGKQNEKPSGEPEIEAQNAATVMKGHSQILRFSLRDPQLGFHLTPTELETKHTQKLHTMVVNQSLTDYHHLHPQFNPQNGLWEAEFTPHTQEKYTAWHDYTLCDNKQEFHTKTELPSLRGLHTPSPVIQQQNEAFAGGYHVVLDSGPIKSGEANMVTMHITDASGNPVTHFEPIMAADAHLVGFTKDGNTMIHCHPTKTEGNALTFHIEPTQSGLTKFFLQMRPNGQEITIPIGQYIQPPSRMAERVTQSHAHHHENSLAFA
jgi:hypothetical protein